MNRHAVDVHPLHGLARSLPALLLILALSWITAPNIQAQSPIVAVDALVLPESVQQIDGFRLALQVRGLDQQPAYVPLRIVATASTGTFPADRRLTITLDPVYSRDDWLSHDPPGVRLDLQLRQGQSRAIREVYIPRWSMDGVYRVSVSQRDGPLPGYAGQLGTRYRPDSLMAQQILTATGRTGVILPREAESPEQPWQVCPDLRWMQAVLRPELLASSRLHDPLHTPAERIAALRDGEAAVHRVLSEDQLPRLWLGYDTLDLLVAPLPLLERLAQNQPEQWRAVRQWLAGGGNLWVYAAGDRQRVADLLQTAAAATTADDPEFAALVRAYNPLSVQKEMQDELLNANANSFDAYSLFMQDPDMGFRPQVAENLEQLRQVPVLTPRQMAAAVWVQPYLAGQVIALADAQPFPGDLQLWTTAKRLTQHRASALVRRGTDVTSGSPRFWHWVLPEVARPPVYTFLGVLAVFAVLVGPVAYRRTTRAGRQYLMFLIAPALAMLTTIGMFGYGLVADGLGVQARVRQISWLDGGSGHAVQWSRGTYFAGLRLSDGLTFAADAAVYPYPQFIGFGRRRNRSDERAAGATEWITLSDERQHLSSSFLPSRTQRQFLSLQPIDSLGRIELAPPGSGSRETLLRNATSLDIIDLVVRDGQGDFWTSGKAPAGGSATATRISPAEAARRLRTYYNLQRPDPPPGFDTGNRRLYAGTDWVSAVLREHNWDAGALDGLFETQLRNWTDQYAPLPTNSFLGTASIWRDAIAVDEAEVSDSIHYVMGSLP